MSGDRARKTARLLGEQDRPPARENVDEADGDTGTLSPSAYDEEDVVHWHPGKEGGALEGTPEKDQRFAYLKYDN